MKKIFLIAIVILLVVLLGVFLARRRPAQISYEAREEEIPAELKFPTEPSDRPSVPVTLPKPEAPTVPKGDVVLTADFSEKAGEVRWIGSGFLSSLDAFSLPPDEKIRPLRPRLWRDWRFWLSGEVGVDLYKRMKKLSPVVQFDMANSWLDSKNFMPCKDWNAWSEHVGRVASDFKKNGMDMEWLVWGEPDNGSFFGPGKCKVEDFLTLHELAFKEIRKVFPAAVVGGPGLANANPEGWPGIKKGMVMLLDHCVLRGCELNFVSWHEYIDENVSQVSEHLKEMENILASSQYAPLNVKKIYIGETIGGAAIYSPGHQAVMFYELEDGGADGTGKACWPVPGPGECDYNSMDGLLVDGSFEPRSVWWVFRAYAAQAGEWVKTKSTNPALAMLASSDGKKYQALAGYSGFAKEGGGVKKTTLELKGLRAGNYKMKIFRIQNTLKAPLLRPELLSEKEFSVSSGAFSFNIDSFRPDDAYYLVLEP